MTENSNPRTPCRVLRCLTPAAWQLVVTDNGRTLTTGHYCGEHAAQNVLALPRAGRRAPPRLPCVVRDGRRAA